MNTLELREKPIKYHPVVEFFTWLRKVMLVEEILRVVVKDDRDNPCSDEVVEESLEKFNVRFLDWNRQDISCEVFRETMKDIRGISLYWGGNDAVLRGWAGETGLPALQKVRRLS